MKKLFFSGQEKKGATEEAVPKPARPPSIQGEKPGGKTDSVSAKRRTRNTVSGIYKNPNVLEESVILHNQEKIVLLENLVKSRSSRTSLTKRSILRAEESYIDDGLISFSKPADVDSWAISVRNMLSSREGVDFLKLVLATEGKQLFLYFYLSLVKFETCRELEIPARARILVEEFISKEESRYHFDSVVTDSQMYTILLDIFMGKLKGDAARKSFQFVKDQIVNDFDKKHTRSLKKTPLFSVAQSLYAPKEECSMSEVAPNQTESALEETAVAAAFTVQSNTLASEPSFANEKDETHTEMIIAKDTPHSDAKTNSRDVPEADEIANERRMNELPHDSSPGQEKKPSIESHEHLESHDIENIKYSTLAPEWNGTKKIQAAKDDNKNHGQTEDDQVGPEGINEENPDLNMKKHSSGEEIMDAQKPE